MHHIYKAFDIKAQYFRLFLKLFSEKNGIKHEIKILFDLLMYIFYVFMVLYLFLRELNLNKRIEKGLPRTTSMDHCIN